MEKFRKENKESIEGKNISLINYKNKQNKIQEYKNKTLNEIVKNYYLYNYRNIYIYILGYIYEKENSFRKHFIVIELYIS